MISRSEQSRPNAGAAVAFRKCGGWILAIGSLCVMITCSWYLAAPPDVIAPTLVISADARAAAIHGADAMRWAGTFGIIGNPIMATGALLLGIESAIRVRPAATAGWCLIFFSLIVFELVDGLVGFAVPVAASHSDAAFLAVRTLFSAYFLAGTTLFGVGTIFVTASLLATGGWRCWVSRVAFINGIVAILAGGAGFIGLSAPSLVGATIGVGALAFACIGVGFAIENGGTA